MFKNMKKRIKNEKGLTLIELLAVIVILAIIAAIAIPAIGNIIQNSRDKAVLSEAVNILSGAKIAHTEGACDASSTDGCGSAVLNNYIDGVTLGEGEGEASATVTLDEDVWSIEYSRFGEIDDESAFDVDGDSIEEEDLTALLD
ncbi:prepilin-type N-terminal cleavage/methylation domain-containing protein [Ureibacillus sp. GCM10028918]|uniref:prepilin-type N-terminal cleavage/methylation domain-containing protein n=1 Tax=Ureibacillus sp. GCM10028918 TaxID=3273429 RepID=UPI0036241C9C